MVGKIDWVQPRHSHVVLVTEAAMEDVVVQNYRTFQYVPEQYLIRETVTLAYELVGNRTGIPQVQSIVRPRLDPRLVVWIR